MFHFKASVEFFPVGTDCLPALSSAGQPKGIFVGDRLCGGGNWT